MREGKALHSVHRGHSSSREHLLLGAWGGPGWTPFSLWMVSDIGDISLSPLCFQGHLAEGLSPGSLRTCDKVAPLPMSGFGGSSDSMRLPPTSCNPGLELPKHVFPFCPPRFPGPCFSFSLAEGSSAALRCPQKLSGNPRPLPRLFPTFPTQSCLSPLLSPSPSIITTYFQSVQRSGAEPSPCSKQRHLLFLFLFLPKTSHLRTGRLPPASPRCHFGSGLCRLAAASQGPLLAVGSTECCSHPAWKALH